tara:strand:+ start:223 stop:399 length:177 start_codon:yes stop_codon:yes gene_type:complete
MRVSLPLQKFENGAMYEGEWLEFENVMDGKGVLIDEFGNLYEGSFVNGQFEGLGRMID